MPLDQIGELRCYLDYEGETQQIRIQRTYHTPASRAKDDIEAITAAVRDQLIATFNLEDAEGPQ